MYRRRSRAACQKVQPRPENPACKILHVLQKIAERERAVKPLFMLRCNRAGAIARTNPSRGNDQQGDAKSGEFEWQPCSLALISARAAFARVPLMARVTSKDSRRPHCLHRGRRAMRSIKILSFGGGRR